MSNQSTCEDCGNKIAYSEGVHLQSQGTAGKLLCNECFNVFMSRKMDLDFEHPRFPPIAMDDCDGSSHHFEFRTMLCGDVVTLRAVEPLDGGKQGYEFVVVGDPEDDPMNLFKRLYERMSRELSRRHLVESDLGTQIGDDAVVRARITWDDDHNGRLPLLVIDGREVAWHELGRMLMSYEGWKFKLEIFELSEEG